jgi:hypothetical protein
MAGVFTPGKLDNVVDVYFIDFDLGAFSSCVAQPDNACTINKDC